MDKHDCTVHAIGGRLHVWCETCGKWVSHELGYSHEYPARLVADRHKTRAQMT